MSKIDKNKIAKKADLVDTINRINNIETGSLNKQIISIFKIYKDLFKNSFQSGLITRLLTMWRNWIVLKISKKYYHEYVEWSRTWDDCRIIIRDIRAWDLFLILKTDNTIKIEIDALFIKFFWINWIYWEIFLISNLLINVYTYGNWRYWISGFINSSIFLISQLQIILLDSNLEILKERRRKNLIFGLSRNLILEFLSHYYQNSKIFLHIHLLNNLIDGIQWYFGINQETKFNFIYLIKCFNQIFDKENIQKLLYIIFVKNFNISSSNFIGGLVNKRIKSFWENSHFLIYKDIANLIFYFFYNLYQNVVKWIQRDTISIIMHLNQEDTNQTDEDILLINKSLNIWTNFCFYQTLVWIWTLPICFKQLSKILMYINPQMSFDHEIVRNQILQNAIHVTSHQSMVPIENFLKWENYYFKYEILFHSFLDLIPFLILNNYFLGLISNIILHYIITWFCFFFLRFKSYDIIKNKISKTVISKLFVMNSVTTLWILIMQYITYNIYLKY